LSRKSLTFSREPAELIADKEKAESWSAETKVASATPTG